MNEHLALDDAALEHLARQRAGLRQGWLLHAALFAATCAAAALAALLGPVGAAWLLPGWALGLAIHGAVAWRALPGGLLAPGLLRQERRRLAMQDDPW